MAEDAEMKLKIEIGAMVIKTLVDSIMSHDLLKADSDNQSYLNCKQQLLFILRDNAIDCTLKHTVIEGVIRLLMSQKVDSPEEFIAALILQYFERPDSYPE